MYRIVLLWPPASGKGTQCKLISEMLSVPNLGTGNLLRREVELKSDVGVQVEDYIEQGKYVPDELILEMVRNWVVKQPEGWLLDGFPRTLPQAEALEKLDGVDPPVLAIALDVEREDLERRMSRRRECEDCGDTVSVSDESEVTCASCGGRLKKRSDDVLESFKVRYVNYEELTLPLFDFYEGKGILIRVDGSQSPEGVFAQIKENLAKRLNDGEA